MRHSALILALALAAATKMQAQTPAAGLAAMLGRMPDPAALPGAMIVYADPAAVRGLDVSAVPGADPDPILQQMRAFTEAPFAMHLSDPRTAWRGAVGFGPAEVRQMAALVAPPLGAMVLELEAGTAAAVGPALQVAGYRWHDQPAPGAWARGQDNAVDLLARNPDDPFGGDLGRAARVQVEGDLLRQATAWPLLSLLAGIRPASSVAAQPDVAALLQALDALVGTGVVLQAVLWRDAGGLGLADPLDIVSGAIPLPSGPAPAWRAALLADLSDGPRSTGVLALGLTLPEPAAKTAAALRARVAQAWAERPIRPDGGSFADLIGDARIAVSPAGGGLWVLTVAHDGPTGVRFGWLTDNAAFRHMHTGAMIGELVFLQP